MTKARDIADFKFENIVDTGTEGTKVASGTTAQRGSTQGQWRYNTTTGFFEGYDGTAFSTLEPDPTVSSISPTTATAGGTSITITGSNFFTGATVKFIGNDGTEYTSPSVTVNSATQITATTPATALLAGNEPYDVRVTSSSGKIGVLDDALDAGGSPAWSTASGNIATGFEGVALSGVSVSASDPDGTAVAYSETGGSVLSSNSLTLNSSTGAITGNFPASSSASGTTLSFNIRASSGGDNTDRAFNIITKDLGSPWGWWKNEDIGSGGSQNSTWNDSSGNNRHFTKTGSNWTYSSSDSNFNNLQSIGHLSDSTGTYYVQSNSPMNSGGEQHTGFVVMRRSATQGNGYGDGVLVWNDNDSTPSNSVSHDFHGDHNWGVANGQIGNNSNTYINETLIFMVRLTGSNYSYEIVRNGSNSWTTNLQTNSGSFPFTSATWDRFSLFNFINASHANHGYLGYMAECVWFKGTGVSDTLRDNWKDYFKAKFNI
jgi:hypothetical protein